MLPTQVHSPHPALTAVNGYDALSPVMTAANSYHDLQSWQHSKGVGQWLLLLAYMLVSG